MQRTPRRMFLKQSGLGVAGAAVLTSVGRARAADAGEKLVMGLIGCGGRGTSVARGFAGREDAEVAYVCDPDEGRQRRAAGAIESVGGKAPRQVADLRKILDDQAVDAVIIATPDHWHGPAAILACDAGKHVYVEKPASHNIREGRLMIEAARRNKRVMQTGTQSRSGPAIIEAIQLVRDGAIGEILIAKAWNSQKRANIGHQKPSGQPPAGFSYDLWLGPAPEVPFQSNRFHYTWHWWFAFGTGDMGNDGVHDIDIARWGLGVDRHPTHVSALGGKYYFDDDQQFPDTQYVVFEWPGDGAVGNRRQLVYEHRIWSPYRQEGHSNGNAFYGTEGMLLLGKGDNWKLFGPRNELIKQSPAGPRDPQHQQNFVDCIRSGGRPNADIEIGHLSATLCHLGNIAARLGGPLEFDPDEERFVGNDRANELVSRTYRDRHWAVPKGV